MMEWIPVALGCGHLLQGPAWFESGGGKPTLVECPEGCGMVEFVLPPGIAELDPDPGTAQVIDLGYLEEGDNIEITVKPE